MLLDLSTHHCTIKYQGLWTMIKKASQSTFWENAKVIKRRDTMKQSPPTSAQIEEMLYEIYASMDRVFNPVCSKCNTKIVTCECDVGCAELINKNNDCKYFMKRLSLWKRIKNIFF